MLEHLNHSSLARFLDSNTSFINAWQRDLRELLSSETQFLLFTHKLHAILERGSLADRSFFDFSKVFDKVTHKLLLLKLSKLSTSTWMYLTGFNVSHYSLQFVTFNCSSFSLTPVKSAVPQGSVLRSLLLLIYINHLPSSFRPHFAYLQTTV